MSAVVDKGSAENVSVVVENAEKVSAQVKRSFFHLKVYSSAA